MVLICLISVVAGCNSPGRLDPEVESLGRATGPVQPGKEAVKMPLAPAGKGSVHSGEVLETMSVPNYTYLLIKTAHGDKWAAIPKSEIRVGQSVDVVESMVMKDFSSRTLNRTFPSVIFGVLTEDVKPGDRGEEDQPPKPAPVSPGAKLPSGHPPIGEK